MVRDPSEGKIDEQKTMADYVPEFVGTVRAPIKVIDVMDMTTGLDTADGPEHFANPETVTARMLRAELGEPNKGQVETMPGVTKSAKPVNQPGGYFAYTFTATRALAFLAEAADKVVSDERAVEGIGVFDMEPSASDDAFALIEGIEGVQGACIFIGSAPPDMVAAAHAKGEEFPFFPHQPYYIVDLDAITFGTKVAAVLAMDILGK
jgi:hypothetical protein